MANPIYAEVIPRELTAAHESGLESQVSPSWYVREDGSLDLPKLLGAFQGYFREHSESWVERHGHREAGPQLVLHAYLHRVITSGGRITREYAVAHGRTDLLVEWPAPGETLASHANKQVIECKVLRKGSSLRSVIRRERSKRLSTWTSVVRSRDTCWSSTCGKGDRGKSACSGRTRNRTGGRSPFGDCSRRWPRRRLRKVAVTAVSVVCRRIPDSSPNPTGSATTATINWACLLNASGGHRAAMNPGATLACLGMPGPRRSFGIPQVLVAARQACACIRPVPPVGWCGSHMNVVREPRGGRWSERPRSIHLAADEVLVGPCVQAGGGFPTWLAAGQLGDPQVFLNSHGPSASLAGLFALKHRISSPGASPCR